VLSHGLRGLQLRLDAFSAHGTVPFLREQSYEETGHLGGERSRLLARHRGIDLAYHIVVMLQVWFDYPLLELLEWTEIFVAAPWH